MKIGITGCMGRVGTLLAQELLSENWPDLELSMGLTRQSKADISNPAYPKTQSTEELFEKSDCIIDFTTPEATMNHVELAAKTNTALIIGTTGLSAAHEKRLAEAATNTTIIYAANMSVGVNLLLALVKKAAATLDPNWDIEIMEAHHKHKIDAPSGTALALGHAAAQGRTNTHSSTENAQDNAQNQALYNQENSAAPAFTTDRTGKRKQGDIGFSVMRGGDIVGEHTVAFLSEGERLELTHRATNRALFAKGALKAAQWSKGKENGLYSMVDVLGL